MPRVGAGGDNVTGDRYTLDLGVEPDLGNLLQNLQVANDLLDQSEAKFRAISDAVGSTTQRLASATRQTELLAAQTQRLQNAYQGIAASSMTLSTIGGAAVGGNMMGMGMGGGFFPGQMAFGGMPAAIPSAQQQYSAALRDIEPGMGGEIPSMPPPPPVQRSGGGMPLSFRYNQLEEFLSQYQSGNRLGRFIHGGSVGPTVPAPPPGAIPVVPGALPAPPPPAVGGLAGMGGLIGLASKAAPWLAALEGVRQVWNMYTNTLQANTRYTGMTGGTSFMGDDQEGGFGMSFLGLKARQLKDYFLHPEIGYGNMGKIQESLLSAGFIGGEGGLFESGRSYLMETYKRGLGEVVDQVDLFQEAVQTSGASVGDLIGATDYMRAIARDTNASIGIMMNTAAQNMERFSGAGYTGSSVTAASFGGASMYANAGALTPGVQASGGLDWFGNGLLRAQVARATGVGYLQVGVQAYGNPTQALAERQASEDIVRAYLNQLGFTPEVNQIDYPDVSSWGYQLGVHLAQMNYLPPSMDPTDMPELYDWIYTIVNGRPTEKQLEQQRAALAPVSVSEEDRKIEDTYWSDVASMWQWNQPTSYGMNVWLREKYDVAGENLAGREEFPDGFNGEFRPDQYIGREYQGWINQNNGNTLAILENIYKSGAGAAERTRVKNTKTNEIMRLSEFMQKNPDWAEQFQDPESGLEIAVLDEAENKQIKDKIRDKNDITGWSSLTDFALGGGGEDVYDEDDVTKESEWWASNYQTVASAIGKAVATSLDDAGIGG